MDKNKNKNENKYIKIVLPASVGSGDTADLERGILSQCPSMNEKLLLDFSKTEALYSAGINLLIKLRKKLIDRGGALFLINVSPALKEMLVQLRLDRVFAIFGTGQEFEKTFQAEVQDKKNAANANKFIFVVQMEQKTYRLAFSGFMSSLDDLSSMNNFIPQEGIVRYIMNVENLEVVDTYSGQLFNDFIERLRQTGAAIAFYGAKEILMNVFNLFPAIRSCAFFPSEAEAVAAIQGGRG